MNDLIKAKEWKKYVLAAIVLLIIFVAVEIVPVVVSTNEHEYGGKAVPQAEAEQQAIAFAEDQTGLTVTSARAVHQSDKLLAGYLSKEKLLEEYEDKYDKQFPVDTFQVNLEFAGGEEYGFVYVHMYNKEVVGWSYYLYGERLGDDETAELARDSFLKQIPSFNVSGYSYKEDGDGIQIVTDASIGESSLEISISAQLIDDRAVITQFKPAFVVPDDYLSYVQKQDSLAGWLTGIGYGLMSFVLAILAIAYSILYRKFSSFTYGIILTSVFFVTYVIANLGVMDGMLASQGETNLGSILLISVIITTILLSVAMGASVYFSIIAGDGLWKAQGRNLWPRLREPGYGDHIWRSMGLSYLFAAIMLGLQPLIFLALEKLIGTWGASDVTMSPYNMSPLWLMPALAWAAAISEEAIFRFFGIGLFRRWFRNTFAAAILPTLFWALGHVMYPFYPSTTRLFELMVIGLLFSFIFVRYGFITAMFTHAIFNSVAIGSSLIMVGGALNISSAVFFILLPLIIAYILRAWSKRKRMKPPIVQTVHPAEPQ